MEGERGKREEKNVMMTESEITRCRSDGITTRSVTRNEKKEIGSKSRYIFVSNTLRILARVTVEDGNNV